MESGLEGISYLSKVRDDSSLDLDETGRNREEKKCV